MKLDRFIKRPVLSTVISILVVILGVLGLVSLPIEQYPNIAPPTIMVRAAYTGANSETVLNSVLAPLEEQINGVEGMTYMTSSATNDGSASITVFFKQGMDADMCQVNVQNRVSQASALLPAEVTKAGVQVMKRQSSTVILFGLTADDDRYDAMKAAAEGGAKVIVAAGFMQATALTKAAAEFTDVKFVFVDRDSAVTTEDGTALKNVLGICFQEEQCGYLAGYAVVKEGYTKLGFTGGGGGDNPACCRYGYGFVQGASAAAAEMGVKVEMNYSWLYGASFSASTELQTMASGWYENGTEVIFACGGNMFQSVAAAAAANDGAVVGVDVDQSSQSDTVITSAMKGLSASVQWACGKVYDGSFDEIGGTFVTLGAKDNAVGLPTATWSLTKWTVDDYNAMLAKMADGSLVVDNDYSKLDSTDSLTLNLVK